MTTGSLDVDRRTSRQWVDNAVRLIEADAQRSADTHLLRYPLPSNWTVQLYLKDESTHITGSLKHRLARSLFLYAICNGWVTEETTVIEASSGSTAVSEAYFAKLLGLDFVAVMPASTSPAKIALIEAQGGRCHFVSDPSSIYSESHRLASELNGHYMDQFTHAERRDGLARKQQHRRIDLHSARTRGTSDSRLGGRRSRDGRNRCHDRPLSSLPEIRHGAVRGGPEHSVFFDAWRASDPSIVGTRGSRIEGIGRPRVEPSFVGQVVDRMIKVPDAGSIAAARHASAALGRKVGGSTGTNLWGAFALIAEMMAAGRSGSVVTLLCDGGERYSGTYYNDEWVASEGIDLLGPTTVLDEFVRSGAWTASS